jgi:glucosyl-3-phosphoglycerate synthase
MGSTFLDAKKARGITVGVCLPALDEAATIGTICRSISADLMTPGIVDQLVVVDSGSSDDTMAIAAAAGATVVRARDLVPAAPAIEGAGKGESLWKSLSIMETDVIVWLDSDTRNFGPHFVTSLVAPLLEDEQLVFTKAFYERPLGSSEGVLPVGGARVTEIAIRPLLNLFFPDMIGFVQPLSGEYAGFREVLLDVPFATGYDVDLLLLLDIVERHGLDAVAQVDLGSRVHRNRDIPSLGRMSFEIMRSLFRRLEEGGRIKIADALPTHIVQFEDTDGIPRPIDFTSRTIERPPMSSLLDV